MAWIPDGTFRMGSEDFYPEEAPVREVAVDGLLDGRAGGHCRRLPAVRPRDRIRHGRRAAARPEGLPGRGSRAARAGLVGLPDDRGAGAAGRQSQLVGVRAGRVLEAAGRAGDDDQRPRPAPRRAGRLRGRGGLRHLGRQGASRPRPSGSTRPAAGSTAPRSPGATSTFPGGKPAANTWQGEFPWQNLKADGFEGTAPVGSFPPNGYGLYDMTGNTWEWTSDWFAGQSASSPCCAPDLLPGESFPRRVIKGGSHLCAPNYCLRYRPAARQGETIDTSTGHIGFRCVIRSKGET